MAYRYGTTRVKVAQHGCGTGFSDICIMIKSKPAGGLGWKKSVQKVGLNSELRLVRVLGARFEKWHFGTFWRLWCVWVPYSEFPRSFLLSSSCFVLVLSLDLW